MSVELGVKSYFKTAIVVMIVALFSMPIFAQNGPLFEQGKELYKAEKYQEAINSWMKIVDNKKHSASLYYNLGNAHYKLNNIGPSIYYYEKALLLNPNDSDIKNNLAFAENARVDAIEPLPKTIFYQWYHRVSSVLTFDGWAIASVVFSVGFVLLFLLYYFSYSEGKKRLFFVSSMVSILLLGMSLSMVYSTFEDAIKNHPAIIFSESIEVKDGPSLGNETSFTLHEGTKVQIIERDSDWVKIQIANGKDGWIPLSDLKEL
ncbi:MAG: ion channel protein [Flavobacterium sp.]|nr:MAG: ion channel protein [Flavobacterium sp.]